MSMSLKWQGPFSIFYVYEQFIPFCIQGFVEDQFGLGLIARAVEEGIAVIKPSGIMVFNMGGRPGQGVCERLFERRGFRITKLWQTKIMQVVRLWDTRNILSVSAICSGFGLLGPIVLFISWCFYYIAIFFSILPINCLICRLLTQIFQLWLKLRKIADIALSSSWILLGISLYVLALPGHIWNQVAAFHMLCLCIAANFASPTRLLLFSNDF